MERAADHGHARSHLGAPGCDEVFPWRGGCGALGDPGHRSYHCTSGCGERPRRTLRQHGFALCDFGDPLHRDRRRQSGGCQSWADGSAGTCCRARLRDVRGGRSADQSTPPVTWACSRPGGRCPGRFLPPALDGRYHVGALAAGHHPVGLVGTDLSTDAHVVFLDPPTAGVHRRLRRAHRFLRRSARPRFWRLHGQQLLAAAHAVAGRSTRGGRAADACLERALGCGPPGGRSAVRVVYQRRRLVVGHIVKRSADLSTPGACQQRGVRTGVPRPRLLHPPDVDVRVCRHRSRRHPG